MAKDRERESEKDGVYAGVNQGQGFRKGQNGVFVCVCWGLKACALVHTASCWVH